MPLMSAPEYGFQELIVLLQSHEAETPARLEALETPTCGNHHHPFSFRLMLFTETPLRHRALQAKEVPYDKNVHI